VSGVETRFFLTPVLKVPRQCPIFLLVQLYLIQSKAAGSDKVKRMKEKLSRVFTPYDWNVLTLGGLH
jgi:hypothetical protein